MFGKLKSFWQEEDGVTVVELLIVVGVLVAIASLFRKQIFLWVEGLMSDSQEQMQGGQDTNLNSTPKPSSKN
ncbi:hypothetical protein DP73_03800 [Desulfosporosinus sp. HMP52]|uniref:Flp1 family type IVb pilin n=1 Tax=Desulfosporosinus sp. HMP52 TaxID=1487923 RepID=UPI00051F8E5C|nr:Flp1 family type IVb pilin [Desulfosporosinus sp. HMP52]KGK91399.1 hypothetical protein DP73_03800 [Desulfosporosinus sp. HMP52]